MVAILIACLISAPTVCRTHEMRLVDTMPVQQFLEAQSRAAEWLAARPGWREKSLRVEVGISA